MLRYANNFQTTLIEEFDSAADAYFRVADIGPIAPTLFNYVMLTLSDGASLALFRCLFVDPDNPDRCHVVASPETLYNGVTQTVWPIGTKVEIRLSAGGTHRMQRAAAFENILTDGSEILLSDEGAVLYYDDVMESME